MPEAKGFAASARNHDQEGNDLAKTSSLTAGRLFPDAQTYCESPCLRPHLSLDDHHQHAKFSRALGLAEQALFVGLRPGLIIPLEFRRRDVYRVELPAQVPGLPACADQVRELLWKQTLKAV
jgi:hypothetical protein